jgi:formamidopyrimidine-DNA glycosylase
MNSTALHKKIKGADVLNTRILSKVTPAKLKKTVKGSNFKSTARHGKNLFAELSNSKWVTMHFGMTGYLKYYKDKEEAPGHVRVLFNFDNGYHLAYNCLRMLGRVSLTDSVEGYIKKKKLGPDPIENQLSFKDFLELIGNRTGSIKTTLMNQNIIAGIGNIYSDEILFQAGIHPATNIQKLNEDDLKKIYQNMNSVLKKAISVDAEPKDLPVNYLINFRKPGKECPKCSGIIKRQTIGGRSSYFCNKHQKKK